MSIASGSPSARRRFMSGVAILALIAGVSIAYARLRERLAPATLPRLAAADPPPPAQAAPGHPRTVMRVEADGVWVMVAPERRVQRVAPAQYSIVKERILLEPERRVDGASDEIIPARYGYRERRVETRPARMEIETIPAVWERRPHAASRSEG